MLSEKCAVPIPPKLKKLRHPISETALFASWLVLEPYEMKKWRLRSLVEYRRVIRYAPTSIISGPCDRGAAVGTCRSDILHL